MLSFLSQYAKNYLASQNGEEGILLEVCRRLELKRGYSVETGGANGLFCSNTALLLQDHEWSGLFVESNYELYEQCKVNWAGHPKVRSQCSRVDGKNVNAFVDGRCDLLSLDTDGSDYRIFEGLEARPKIVVIEIDSSMPPNQPGFNSDGAGGYFETVNLAIEKSYFVLCHTGNLIVLDEKYRDLFPEVKSKHPLIDSEYYFNRAWLKEEAA